MYINISNAHGRASRKIIFNTFNASLMRTRTTHIILCCASTVIIESVRNRFPWITHIFGSVTYLSSKPNVIKINYKHVWSRVRPPCELISIKSIRHSRKTHCNYDQLHQPINCTHIHMRVEKNVFRELCDGL